MQQTYNIALWRYWPPSTFPITDERASESALLAALSLMERYKLKHVAYAAVRLPNGTFQRWTTGLSLYTESSEQREEEEEEYA